MTDLAADSLAAPTMSRRQLAPATRHLLFAVLAFLAAPPLLTGSLFLAVWILRHLPQPLPPHSQLVVVTVALLVLIALAAGWFFHYWHPLRQLRPTLDAIRAGEAPIDDLHHLGGAARSLAPNLESLLRDWRQHKADLATLDREMRQRIANRTDALERRLGALRQQANRDPLTGLFNRRHLEQQLPPLIEQARREAFDLSLLMIDVDHFKFLNDRLGHPAGDQFLQTVADLFRSTIRGHDLAFRYGGDEFLLLLIRCPHSGAESLAQRLCSLVDAAAKPLHLTPAPRLSIGLLTLSELPGSANASALLQAADQRLYAVKAQHHAGQ